MVHSEVMERQEHRAKDVTTGDQAPADKHEVAAGDGWWDLAKELVNRFNADQCSAWAAALSFFAVLSLVPMLIFGIAVVSLFYHNPQEATDQALKFVASLLPGANASEMARKIITDAKIPEQAATLMKFSGVASIVGVVIFIYTASRVFVNAIPPMNAAFGVKETRGFLMTQVYAFGMLLGAGLLFFLSLLPSLGTAALRKISMFAGLPDPSPWWLEAIFFFVGIGINVLMFTVIYRFLPSPAAKVRWKEAAFGGVIVAVLWEAAKQGFAVYLRNFGGETGYNKVYGSLAGLMILVLWVYYTCTLLLLGAEIARLWGDQEKAKAKATPNSSSGDSPNGKNGEAPDSSIRELPIVRSRGKLENDKDVSGRDFGSGA